MPPRPRAAVFRFAAFTVVELLAVIALLAVLLVLLMPVVQSMRTVSVRVKCASNLRALGQVALLYSADHQGNLVPFRMVAPVGDPAGLWYDHLYEYVGRKRGMAGRMVGALEVEYPGFTCPSVPTTPETRYKAESAFRRYTINRLCGWKGHENPNSGEPQAYLKRGYGFAGTRVIELPGGVAKTAWFICPPPAGGGSFLPEKYDTEDFIGFPHSGSANVLFMDGHVEPLHDPGFRQNPSLLRQPQWIEFFGKAP